MRRLASALVAFAMGAAAITFAADSPLVSAVKKGDEATVRALLAKEAPRKGAPYEVNAPGPEGMTPLHWAARTDQIGILKLLLVAGAQVNAADRYGITPLALAAMGAGLSAGRGSSLHLTDDRAGSVSE